MKVHVCASYKRSPVGFQPGSFTYRENSTENYKLSFEYSSSRIYNLFEQGFITRAQGLTPSHKYLLLIKGVEYTYENHDEFGKIVYINIAFEFNSAKEYTQFRTGYDNLDKSRLEKSMADCIVPDRDDKNFALHIDGEKFDSFVKEINSKGTAASVDVNSFEIKTRSKNTNYSDQIKKIFGVDFEKDDAVYVYPPKKKYPLKRQTHQTDSSKTSSGLSLGMGKTSTAKFNPVIVGIVGGAVVILVVTALLIFGRKDANANTIDTSCASSDGNTISFNNNSNSHDTTGELS